MFSSFDHYSRHLPCRTLLQFRESSPGGKETFGTFNSEEWKRQKLTRSYPISHKKNAKLARERRPKRIQGMRLIVMIEFVNKILPTSTKAFSFSDLVKLSPYLKIRNSGLESTTLSLSLSAIVSMVTTDCRTAPHSTETICQKKLRVSESQQR